MTRTIGKKDEENDQLLLHEEKTKKRVIFGKDR